VKKLKLRMEELRVASFATHAEGVEGPGTVHGHFHSHPPQNTCMRTCPCTATQPIVTCYDPCG